MIQVLSANIGRTQFSNAWKLQKQLWELRAEKKITDVLLLTDHDHVYTLGKGGDEDHLLASPQELKLDGVELYRIDRGGDITYHGPGQLICYPILDLNGYQPDIHRYLRNLEEVIIQTLREYNITGAREEGMTGVWVSGEKIAAIGIKVSRWITMHGFALNVNTDLSKFGRIIPCGIFHKDVTSIKKILGKNLELDQVANIVEKKFSEIFNCSLQHITLQELNQMFFNAPSEKDVPIKQRY